MSTPVPANSPDSAPASRTPASRTPASDAYDVVVVGGAVAAAGTALLVRRFHPAARVLVVESREAFPRKVGEATVEVSGYYLQQVLGQEARLGEEHLAKHGLRFWFSDGPGRELIEMTEVGAGDVPDVPSFQLDRSRLDEGVLASAADAGCEVLRPARITAWEEGWPESRVTVETASGEHTVRCRWLIDGSGRQAFIARRKRLLERVEEHSTAALWSRWHGVADLDEAPWSERLPRPGAARRRLATNHFCGYGWWCWMIPLSDGATSIGLVYDKSLFVPPGDGSLEERYRAFVTSRSGLAELLALAEPEEGDFQAYSHLPYRSRRFAGRGWALVGDAAAFLDPFYSPGLDFVAMSSFATARLVAAELRGELAGGETPWGALDRRLEEHDRRFERSYRRWLEALYLGKYELMGDAELLGCAYLVDTALYYFGVVTPVYGDREAVANPAFGLDNRGAAWAHRILSTFNRRMNRLARFRRATGRYGRHNLGRRRLGRPPKLGRGAAPMLLSGLRLWLRLELSTLGWRVADRLRRRSPADLSRPVPGGEVPRRGGTAFPAPNG